MSGDNQPSQTPLPVETQGALNSPSNKRRQHMGNGISLGSSLETQSPELLLGLVTQHHLAQHLGKFQIPRRNISKVGIQHKSYGLQEQSRHSEPLSSVRWWEPSQNPGFQVPVKGHLEACFPKGEHSQACYDNFSLHDPSPWPLSKSSLQQNYYGQDSIQQGETKLQC